MIELDIWLSKLLISHNNLPEVCWQAEDGTFLHLEFMKHDQGCWAILSCRSTEHLPAILTNKLESEKINIGTFKNVEEVKLLLRGLKVEFIDYIP